MVFEKFIRLSMLHGTSDYIKLCNYEGSFHDHDQQVIQVS